MSKLLAGLGGNTGTVAAGVVIVGVLLLGASIGSKRDAAQNATPAALVQTQPEAVVDQPKADTAVTAPAVDESSEAISAASIPAPAFDEVRREGDGMTVVAGRAVPGATVKLMKDGVEIASTTADGSGKFATLAMIALDGEGHILSLIQSVDGDEVPSGDEIILAPTVAPTAAPIVVAEAEVVKPADVAADTNSAAETAVAAQADVSDETEVAAENVVINEDAALANTQPANAAEVSEVPADAVTDATPVTPEGTEAPAALKTTTETEKPVTPQDDPIEGQVADAQEPTSTPETAVTPPADTEVAVLKSTAEGVELLNPDAPDVMDNVALDTISYSDVGDVQLAGRAQVDTQTVRIYLNNDAVINLPVDAQGRWRGDVPDVDEGIYTLRVDEVGADGTVTSRVETPFKREAPAVLAQVAAQEGPIKAITVQSGATLWAIARDRYGDGALYVRVFKANKSSIRDPDLIYPGQIFDLPD